jgi:pyridoxine 5'-phosphate synthase PdxJ
LDVKDKEHLLKAANSLSQQDIPFSLFYEPDIDDVTAIACYEEEDKFKKYKAAQ